MAKIAVSSTGDNLDAQVDPRFGRCAYFIFVDTDTLKYEAVQNPNVSAASGAGIQTAQLVANKEVEAVLTGNVGPNAFQTLQAAGIALLLFDQMANSQFRYGHQGNLRTGKESGKQQQYCKNNNRGCQLIAPLFCWIT